MPCFLSPAPGGVRAIVGGGPSVSPLLLLRCLLSSRWAVEKHSKVSNREEIVNISPRCPACAPVLFLELLLSPSTLCFLASGLIEFSLDEKVPPFFFNLPSGLQLQQASQTLPQLTPHLPPVAAAALRIIPGMSADCLALQCECRKSQQMRCLMEARRGSADDCFKTQRC